MYGGPQRFLVVPPRPPTCWEFFGFPEPTNKHNLDIRYRERLNSITPAGYENAQAAAYVIRQYEQCLTEIDSHSWMKTAGEIDGLCV